jgi:pteridine reductase
MEALRGKTALVTGASKRVGREISLELARAGSNVVVHYNQSEFEAKKLCEELLSLGVNAWALKASFDVRLEYESLIDRAFDLSKNIDFLINNASVFSAKDSETLSLEAVVSKMEVNAWAPFVLCQKFSERVDQGKIINLLDAKVESFNWSHIDYILSKHMLKTLTKMIALKYAPKITVNAIAPGLILPPSGQPQSYLDKISKTAPLKCHGEPYDIAQGVLFLLNSTFITGNIIYIDGGLHLKECSDG